MSDAFELFGSLEALPAGCVDLFATGGQRSFQLSRAWFEAVLAAAMPSGAHPLFLLWRMGELPGVLFPLRTLASGQPEALTTPYTIVYQPLAAAQLSATAMRAAGAALGRFCRGWGAVRLDALDADWPGLTPLLQGVRTAGVAALRFDHFGNWHANVAGLSWDAYLAARPGTLRATICRRLRKAEADAHIRFEIVDSGAGLGDGIAAYEQVYSHSWKHAEPFVEFGPTLMQAAASAGVLRLGLLRLDAQPIAAQYWTVAGGTATLLKLAHNEELRARSPGTVLTAAMIRLFLEQEEIAELDFGRGDDAYKQLWVGQRRQRIGLVLANPRRLAGLLALGRHRLGQSLPGWVRHL